MEITELAQQEIKKIVSSLNYPQQLCDLAFFQFQDYLKKTKYFVSEEKLNTILKCALLIVIKTLKHQFNQNNFPTSLSYIIQDQSEKIDEIMITLKEWTTFGQIYEEARQEIVQIVESFSYMLTIFNKFEKVFRHFQFEEQNMQQKKYNKQLKHICWLLLIITKQQHETVIETTLLIPAVFQFLLKGAQRFTTGQFLEQAKGNEKQELLKLFQVQDLEQYEATVSRFVNALKPICDSNLLQCDGDIFQIFGPKLIESNIENLSSYYTNNIMIDLDMQYFVIDKKRACNPNNFTPFSRQGVNNKQAAPFPLEKYGLLNTSNSSISSSSNSSSSVAKKQEQANSQAHLDNKAKYASQRLLNYDMVESISESKSIADFKVSNLNVTSPYIVKQQSSLSRAAATPTSNAMEMYNWLLSRKNINSCSTGSIALELKKKIENLDVWLDDQINKLIEFENKQQQEQRKEQIQSLFYRILNEYYNEEKSVNLNVQKGVLVCACESVYFILNVSYIDFQKLVHFIDINWFELWKIMDFIMRLDQTMPVSLKAHILDLEVKIVSYYSWRQDSQLLQFVKAYIQDTEQAKKLLDDRQQGSVIEKFFRRVLHQCAYTINQVCSALKLNDKISEAVWRIMKHILANQSDILLGRHIDQLVICSIYIMCKLFKSETIFKQILNKYEELNSHNKSMMRELIYAMPVAPNKLDTIVSYYNNVYLGFVKEAAVQIYKSLKDEFQISEISSPQSHHKQSKSEIITRNPAIATPIFTSPLKSILPTDVRKSISKLPSHMTPQTQMLYAYSESPLLKENLVSNQNLRSVYSKKMINFDAEINPTQNQQNPQYQFASNAQQQLSTVIQNVAKHGQSYYGFQAQNTSTFSKYIKPNMDSITESQQENQTSNFIPHKFKKATEQQQQQQQQQLPLMKRNLFSQRQNTEGDQSDVTNNSIISCQSTPRVISNNQNNSNIQIQQAPSSQNPDHLQNNSSFLKNFTKQSQYQYNQIISPTKQPQQQISSPYSQQKLISPNSHQQLPLQQIPQQKITSWKNQTKNVQTQIKQQTSILEAFNKKKV
ncbi:hypothetical protein ABPG74_001206 [Tetrahymena malaccensis]